MSAMVTVNLWRGSFSLGGFQCMSETSKHKRWNSKFACAKKKSGSQSRYVLMIVLLIREIDRAENRAEFDRAELDLLLSSLAMSVNSL